MKRRIFFGLSLLFFLDCRSANLLRLFSGNLPAMLGFWSHLTYLTLKNDFLTLKLSFLYLNSKRKGPVNMCHSK